MNNLSDELVARMRNGAHRDIDTIFDSWLEIHENRRTRIGVADVERMRRSAGSHSDPTADAALATTPAMEWLRGVADASKQLQALAANLEVLQGRPACALCGQDLGSRPWRRLWGRRFHDDGCRERAIRERERSLTGSYLGRRK